MPPPRHRCRRHRRGHPRRRSPGVIPAASATSTSPSAPGSTSASTACCNASWDGVATRVPMALVAALIAVNRLVDPRSERGIYSLAAQHRLARTPRFPPGAAVAQPSLPLPQPGRTPQARHRTTPGRAGTRSVPLHQRPAPVRPDQHLLRGPPGPQSQGPARLLAATIGPTANNCASAWSSTAKAFPWAMNLWPATAATPPRSCP